MIHGLTFVRIPKNASTSIYQALGEANTIRDERLNQFMWRHTPRYKGLFAPSHCLLSEAIEELGDKILKVPSFAVVRNPFSRLVSIYGYTLKHDLFYMYGQRRQPFQEFCESFERLAEEDKHFFHAYTQRSFVDLPKPSGPVVGVDWILRFENLNEEFARFMSGCGANKKGKFNLTLPRLNTSPHKPYKDYYCAPTKAVVERMWGDDLEYFGYKF